MISVTRPSRSIRMNALGSKAAGGAAGRSRPSSRPPPTAALTLRNARRDSPSWGATSISGRPLDGSADARVGAAAADIPRHRRVDVGVGRVRLRPQQRGSGHDLARLAVAALHDLHVQPGLLRPLAARRLAHRLDGGEALARHGRYGGGGGAGWAG